MDRTEKIVTRVLVGFLIAGGLFIGLFIWGLSFMGDTIYPLEIQNDKNTGLKIKTYRITRYDKKLTVDSLVLNPKDKLEIGTSHSCSTIDSMFVRFDAIEIFDNDDNSRLLKKGDLIDYLLTMDKAGCSTYLIR